VKTHATVPKVAKPEVKTGASKPILAKNQKVRSHLKTAGLPHSTVAKGLAKGKNDQSMIHSRLKKKSPWYTSIQDPLHGADCKIPDETGVETGTVQLVTRTMVTSVNSVAGCRIFSPYVNIQQNGLPGGGAESEGLNWQVLSSESDTNSIIWNAGGVNTSTHIGLPFPGAADLTAVADSHRIVSAAMYVQPEPSLSSNQGDILLFTEPFEVFKSGSGLLNPSLTDYNNSYKAVNYPMNSNKAAVVRWYPFARNDWNFKSFIRTNGEQDSDDDTSADSYPAWNIGFIATGLADTAVAFRVTMVVNYEFLPKFNSLNILGTSPSPQDATETDLVENWVQDMDVASVIPQRTIASSPSTVSPAHEDDTTGFGMFFQVIKELAPLALALI